MGWQCGGCYAMNSSPAKRNSRTDSDDGYEDEEWTLECGICGEMSSAVRSTSESGLSARRVSGETKESWLGDLYQPTPQQLAEPPAFLHGFGEDHTTQTVAHSAFLTKEWEDRTTLDSTPGMSHLIRDLEVEAEIAQTTPQPTLLLQGLEDAAAEVEQ